VAFNEQARVYSGYEVSLSFSNVWGDGHPGSPLIPHVRLRDFEAPMCRACYLTGHTDEIEEFYEIGKEIDTYRSPEELVDKARFYLRDAAAAERLRDAGFRRARRDHTWVERFRQLFSEVGLPAEGFR
jgi:spore maturation protein CgeB